MSEQWFLDLDGIRSGPYQTSEVLSLVAEGEILPHHQIATELKSQKWMTVLEWRLNHSRVATPLPSSPVEASPASEPADETLVETPVEIPVKIEVPEHSSETLTPTQPSPEAPPIEKPVAIPVEIHTEEPVSASQPAPAPPATPPNKPGSNTFPSASALPKRDPMAEMFDMLQNTKQKREVKAQQTHAQSHSHSPAHTTASKTVVPPYEPEIKTGSSAGNLGKTIFVGAIVTFIGFALGQYFQHQKTSEPPITVTKPQTSTPTAPTEVTPINPTTVTPIHESETVVDRSTDKMTIRAKVPVNSDHANPNPAPNRAKDGEELKDLKNELLELKALKDEIRNSGENPEQRGASAGSSNDTPEPANNNPQPETDPNAAPLADPNSVNPNPNVNQSPTNPEAPNADRDVHY